MYFSLSLCPLVSLSASLLRRVVALTRCAAFLTWGKLRATFSVKLANFHILQAIGAASQESINAGIFRNITG